jgi:hypothetical protein
MDLVLVRKTFTKVSTIGDFLIDGDLFCYSLEDMVREPGVKVPGQTAIPEGCYRVIIDQSARFRRAMPHVLDVPGFEGIRIHNGNTPEHTEGCILLGYQKGKDFIGDSKRAFNDFFDRLYYALAKGEAWITIRRESA